MHYQPLIPVKHAEGVWCAVHIFDPVMHFKDWHVAAALLFLLAPAVSKPLGAAHRIPPVGSPAASSTITLHVYVAPCRSELSCVDVSSWRLRQQQHAKTRCLLHSTCWAGRCSQLKDLVVLMVAVAAVGQPSRLSVPLTSCGRVYPTAAATVVLVMAASNVLWQHHPQLLVVAR